MTVSFRDGADSGIQQEFDGAKLALFVGPRLLTILRDDFEHIPWPGFWDLPGGGREGAETPVACALRETYEEVGLTVPDAAIKWSRAYQKCGVARWFFAAHIPAAAETDIVLGSEGQCWTLMTPQEYLGHEKAIPDLQDRLSDYQHGRR